MQLPDTPYKILALAPFTLTPSQGSRPGPISVDRQSLDDAMRAMAITGYLPLERDLCVSGGLDLHFDSIKSLHPDGMAKTIPCLVDLLAARQFIAKARQNGESAGRILEQLGRRWPDLPALELKDAPPKAMGPRTSSDRVDSLLDMVAMPDQASAHQPVNKDETHPIDARVQSVLEAVFQWPAFRQMEAAWRGLRLLLQQGIEDSGVAVEIMPIHQQHLESTIEALMPLILDHPPSMVLLDLAFDNSPLGMQHLTRVAQWAGTLMTPVITWATASFLQIDGWDRLATLPYLPNHLSQPEYAKYQKLRDSGDGHWISLCCNRILARYPYGQDNPPRNVAFAETLPPWISPVWALGTLAAQSIGHTGWPTHLTNRQQFSIRNLALLQEAGPRPMALEADIGRDRHDQFIRAGLIPLISERDAAFATRAVTISGASLAYQLLICRITQFVFWCKDNLPAETDAAGLQIQLKLAFQVLSEQSRPSAFESADISVGRPNDEGRFPVHIAIVPNASLLPSRQPVEMHLTW